MKSPWDELPPRDEKGRVLAVIEASSESRCKFKFEPKRGVFELEGMLPTGTAFPHSFGFIPATLGQDGDPIDIVAMTDEPPPVSTVVPCRLVAILAANQTEKGKTIRNDRLLAVAECSERYHQVQHKKDIEQTILDRIAQFFAFYHREKGKTFLPIGWKGKGIAERALRLGIQAATHPKRPARAPDV
jgi:inorganic pyrophosphatase